MFYQCWEDTSNKQDEGGNYGKRRKESRTWGIRSVWGRAAISRREIGVTEKEEDLRMGP